MSTNVALLAAVVLIVAAVAYSLAVYSALPEKVPSHWNIHGQVDGWMSKPTAALLAPGVMALLTLGLIALPWLSPRNFQVDSFRRAFNYIMFAVVAMMGYLHVVMIQAGLHAGLDVSRVLIGGICLFLALIGNALGKVRRNFWMGVRTPWTLASEKVWAATHRLAARLMVAAGLAGALLISLGTPPVIVFVIVIAAALLPALHSLVLYKRLEREGGV